MAAEQFEKGKKLGHYRIDGELGAGGMSVLYRATDTKLGRKVALKVMGQALTDDHEFRERFVDEARNTSAVEHANVVPLYDFGEIDGLLYIAMRLVDGADLSKLVANGPLEHGRTISLLRQAADALDTVHDRGLVHLDVKPANMLVTSKEGATEHVYLADFGLTRRGATGHRTLSGDFLGSPTFAAPEHLRGDPVDGRTDVYALACILFVCLTGRAPYLGSVQDVIVGHLQRPVPPVSSLTRFPAGVDPRKVDAVVTKGMAKALTARYATCRELVDAVAEALGIDGEKTQKAPIGPVSGPIPAQQPTTGPWTSQRVPNPAISQPVRNPVISQRVPNPVVSAQYSLPPLQPYVAASTTPSKPTPGWIVPALVAANAVVLIIFISLIIHDSMS